MIKYDIVSDCVGCETCRHCGRSKAVELIYFKCDCCRCVVDTLYNNGGQHLCVDCILNDYSEINEENFEEFI